MQHNKYKKAKIMKFLTLSRRETQNQMAQLKNKLPKRKITKKAVKVKSNGFVFLDINKHGLLP